MQDSRLQQMALLINDARVLAVEVSDDAASGWELPLRRTEKYLIGALIEIASCRGDSCG